LLWVSTGRARGGRVSSRNSRIGFLGGEDRAGSEEAGDGPDEDAPQIEQYSRTRSSSPVLQWAFGAE
jgi:hypothetical protein